MRIIVVVMALVTAAVPIAMAISDGTVQEPRRYLPPHALACGAPTLDVTDYDLVGVSEDGTPYPDLPMGAKALTFDMATWKCIFPFESQNLQTNEGLMTPATHLQGSFHGTHPSPGIGVFHDEGWPRTGSTGGYLKVMILTPTSGTWNFPYEGCNWNDVYTARSWLHTAVYGGSSNIWCYQWTQMNEPYGQYDIGTLIGWMHGDVHRDWYTLIDEPNELVLGVVHAASNNGAAWERSKFAYLAEEPTNFGYVNLYDDSIVLHEFGHALGAVHSGANPNICGGAVSVMNYCWIGSAHASTFDSGNRDIVRNSYWSS